MVEIQAELTYSIRTADKPVSASVGPLGRIEQRGGRHDPRTVSILDLRDSADSTGLDVSGFELVAYGGPLDGFTSSEQIRAEYYPEMSELVRAHSGAREVVVFDHTVRHADVAVQEAERLREPVSVVHNDYTEWSGPQRVRDLMGDRSAELLKRRVAVIQCWRPLRGPVESHPLALCDARSVEPADLIAAERRHPNRVGEIYHVAHNAQHRWYYTSEMLPTEAYIFKCYDSEREAVARFTPHASFRAPRPSPAPRQSIEVRCLVFF